MTTFDLNAPATLHWTSKEVPHERPLNSVSDAVRVAMKELRRAEFFSASIVAGDHVFRGDEIVEIFQTGGLTRRSWASF